jgi:hypothetical protein
MAENGPWSSANTQLFIGPLIDNLIAVLQADWVEGLEAPVHTEVNGGEPMTPYQNWHQSVFVPVIEDDSQPYGFIRRHDGTLSDLLFRLGVRHSIAAETTGATPMTDAIEVNRLWIEGLFELAADA